MSLSAITVSGTLTDKPEKSLTPSNIPVTNLKLAICYVSRNSANRGNLTSEIIRINAWRDLAEYCEKLDKGDKVLVTGRALINSFTKNGKKKRVLEIDAVSVVLVKSVLELHTPLKSHTDEALAQDENPKNKIKNEFDETSTLEEVVSNAEEIPF